MCVGHKFIHKIIKVCLYNTSIPGLIVVMFPVRGLQNWVAK